MKIPIIAFTKTLTNHFCLSIRIKSLYGMILIYRLILRMTINI